MYFFGLATLFYRQNKYKLLRIQTKVFSTLLIRIWKVGKNIIQNIITHRLLQVDEVLVLLEVVAILSENLK